MVADLRAESDSLDALVGDLPPESWATETPAPGWTIAHQIAHLLWTDRVSLISVTDEPGFAEVLGRAAENPTGFVDAGAEELAVLPPAQLLTEWRATRAALHDGLLTVADGRKLPWFGPPMSAASMATARAKWSSCAPTPRCRSMSTMRCADTCSRCRIRCSGWRSSSRSQRLQLSFHRTVTPPRSSSQGQAST